MDCSIRGSLMMRLHQLEVVIEELKQRLLATSAKLRSKNRELCPEPNVLDKLGKVVSKTGK